MKNMIEVWHLANLYTKEIIHDTLHVDCERRVQSLFYSYIQTDHMAKCMGQHGNSYEILQCPKTWVNTMNTKPTFLSRRMLKREMIDSEAPFLCNTALQKILVWQIKIGIRDWNTKGIILFHAPWEYHFLSVRNVQASDLPIFSRGQVY